MIRTVEPRAPAARGVSCDGFPALLLEARGEVHRLRVAICSAPYRRPTIERVTREGG